MDPILILWEWKTNMICLVYPWNFPKEVWSSSHGWRLCRNTIPAMYEVVLATAVWRSWLQVTYALYPRDVSWCIYSCWKPIYNWGHHLVPTFALSSGKCSREDRLCALFCQLPNISWRIHFLKKSAADMIRTHDCSARKISTCMCRKSYHGIHAVGLLETAGYRYTGIPYSILHQIPGGCLLEMTPLLIYQPVGKPCLWFTVSLQHG